MINQLTKEDNCEKLDELLMNTNKRLKIFSLPWHVAHQYELLKLPFDFFYIINHTRTWSDRARPLNNKVKWVLHYEPGKYDLAILHVDQQCLLPEFGKTKVFKELKAQITDIPIIVINHGTPVYPEKFKLVAEEAGYDSTEEAGEKWAREEMVKLLKGVSKVVCNSYKAKEMWGLGDLSQVILHGIDPEEWRDLTKEPRIVTFISPSGIGDKYYGRRLFSDTRTVLKDKYGIELVWISHDKHCADWDDYRYFLGKSLVYFNPTFGSPNPRTRLEAMMSGCCVVTTRHQDADKWFKNGVNGFLINDNPEEAAKVLSERIFDYKGSIKVGQEGKRTAKKLFSGERFRKDWIKLIEEVLGQKIT